MNLNLPPRRPLVLDVTLRDGGYLNQWGFSATEIDRAVSLAAASDADLIEVGYLDDQPGLPEAAACPPDMLRRVRALSGRAQLAAMIRPSVADPDAVLAARAGLVDLLRIPVDMRWPDKAFALALRCHAQGFAVSLNLTGVTTFSLEHIGTVGAQLPEFACVVYLADSRGKLQESEIAPLVASLRQVWPGAIGYHAHDNLGLAKANSEAALAAGCTWLDGSIAGVGLGGRNLSLADAVALAQRTRPELRPSPEALAAEPAHLGLSAPGAEMPLYRLTGERNLRMEWVEPLIAVCGLPGAAALIAELPVQNWFEPAELRPFLGEALWEQVAW